MRRGTGREEVARPGRGGCASARGQTRRRGLRGAAGGLRRKGQGSGPPPAGGPRGVIPSSAGREGTLASP